MLGRIADGFTGGLGGERTEEQRSELDDDVDTVLETVMEVDDTDEMASLM